MVNLIASAGLGAESSAGGFTAPLEFSQSSKTSGQKKVFGTFPLPLGGRLEFAPKDQTVGERQISSYQFVDLNYIVATGRMSDDLIIDEDNGFDSQKFSRNALLLGYGQGFNFDLSPEVKARFELSGSVVSSKMGFSSFKTEYVFDNNGSRTTKTLTQSYTALQFRPAMGLTLWDTLDLTVQTYVGYEFYGTPELYNSNRDRDEDFIEYVKTSSPIWGSALIAGYRRSF